MYERKKINIYLSSSGYTIRTTANVYCTYFLCCIDTSLLGTVNITVVPKLIIKTGGGLIEKEWIINVYINKSFHLITRYSSRLE